MSIVSLSFDEGRESQFKYALPIFNELNYQGTVYLLTNFIGKLWREQTVCTKLMSLKHIRTLENAGWEIGSHTHTHLNLVFASKNEFLKEIIHSKKILSELNINQCGIAYPGGVLGTDSYLLVKKHFLYGRSATNAAIFGMKDISLDCLKKTNRYFLFSNVINEMCFNKIDFERYFYRLKKNNLWCIFSFHEILESGSKENGLFNTDDELSYRNFISLLNIIKKSRIPVRPVKEVVAKYYFQDSKLSCQYLLSKDSYALATLGYKRNLWLLQLYERHRVLKYLYSLLPKKKL